MNMAGDHPASYQIHASPTQDLLAALVLPSLLVILTVPFTILRVLLLGWNCTLARHTFPDTEEEEEEDSFLGLRCVATGWGQTTQEGDLEPRLHQVSARLHSD